MTDHDSEKTPLEELQDTLARLKEMEHYSQGNIEKLATLWLTVSDNKSQKQYEAGVDRVLKEQNRFQEAIAALIEDFEKEAARLRAEEEKAAAGSAGEK